MATAETELDSPVGEAATESRLAELSALLEQTFQAPFHVFDGESGELIEPSAALPRRDWSAIGDLCSEVVRRGRPEFLEEED